MWGARKRTAYYRHQIPESGRGSFWPIPPSHQSRESGTSMPGQNTRKSKRVVNICYYNIVSWPGSLLGPSIRLYTQSRSEVICAYEEWWPAPNQAPSCMYAHSGIRVRAGQWWQCTRELACRSQLPWTAVTMRVRTDKVGLIVMDRARKIFVFSVYSFEFRYST